MAVEATVTFPPLASANPVELRASRAAERTEVDAKDIERLPFDLSVLDSEGVFINVDATGFGMLDRRLSWEALGITLPRGTGVAFRPPRCGLLPDRYRLPLLRPPARAHAALHKYSHHFRLTETLFEGPSYRWVPWTAFDTFEQEFLAAQQALEAARVDVLDHYDAICQEVTATFLALASDSVRRLEATGQAIPADFEQTLVSRVTAAIPKPQDIRDKLRLRFHVGVLLLGSEIIAEQRQAVEERRQLQQAEAVQRLEMQRQEAEQQLVQEELWAEQERIRQHLEHEAEERRREAATKERLRNLKIEAARERLQDQLSPLEEGAKQLHTAVYEAVTAIRDSHEKHGCLRGGTAKRVRELKRWYQLMDWQSDTQMQQLISEMERLARQPKKSSAHDPQALKRVFDDIVQLCYADARELAQPHRLNALEL